MTQAPPPLDQSQVLDFGFEHGKDEDETEESSVSGSGSGKFRKPESARRLLTSTSSSSTPAPKIPKLEKAHKMSPIDAALYQHATKDEDEDGLFGRSVAAFLRSLPEEQRIPARLRIEMVMYSVKYGQQIVLAPPLQETAVASAPREAVHHNKQRSPDPLLPPKDMPQQFLDANVNVE